MRSQSSETNDGFFITISSTIFMYSLPAVPFSSALLVYIISTVAPPSPLIFTISPVGLPTLLIYNYITSPVTETIQMVNIFTCNYAYSTRKYSFICNYAYSTGIHYLPYNYAYATGTCMSNLPVNMPTMKLISCKYFWNSIHFSLQKN